MTNDEIRAHHAQLRKALQGQTTGLHAVSCTAIETLLAREAEVLAVLSPPETKWMDGFESGRAQLSDEIRAILYPQPAVPAEEKTKP